MEKSCSIKVEKKEVTATKKYIKLEARRIPKTQISKSQKTSRYEQNDNSAAREKSYSIILGQHNIKFMNNKVMNNTSHSQDLE